ncbi:MAG: TPM domain-containing protein [Pontiellaceae bacterium]|jgi:uncharacterized protein|nr:TPM domain-containing protein [Pontiellaceae bacterium]
MRKFVTLLLLFFLAEGLAAYAGSDRLLQELKPVGRVNDFAGVMSAEDRSATERLLAELENKTGVQIAVVSLKSMEGGQIDDFATRLFERWGIGQKGKDNGLLLLAAIEDRKVRVEVGYGLEGILSDAAAGRLIDQYIVPFFRSGDYSGGLRKGAEALASVTASGLGVALTGIAYPDHYTRASETSGDGFFPVFLFFTVIILVILGFHSISNGGDLCGGGLRGGGGFGGGGFGGGMSGGGGASRGW